MLHNVCASFFCLRYIHPLKPLPDPEETLVSTGNQVVHPVSLDDIKTACSNLKLSLQMSAQEADDLEQRTRDQSANKEWYESRRLRLTASVFHQVINMKRNTCPSTFLKQQLYTSGRHKTKAMKLGLEREDGAAQRYKMYRESQGDKITLSQAGFRVSSTRGFLGASTDRIATDMTGSQVLVELKNPQNTWEVSDVFEVPKKQKCLKVTSTDDGVSKVTINTKHAYYTQIQGQLFVYNCSACDFVLCSRHAMHVERIYRDEPFIENMVYKLEDFFDNVYAPEVVYPRVKSNLSPFDLRSCQ